MRSGQKDPMLTTGSELDRCKSGIAHTKRFLNSVHRDVTLCEWGVFAESSRDLHVRDLLWSIHCQARSDLNTELGIKSGLLFS